MISMPPNDITDKNSPYPPLSMEEVEELPEEGFVIVSYSGDDNSENEMDADDNVNDNTDVNCHQSTEGYSLLSQNEDHQMDCSSDSEDDCTDDVIKTEIEDKLSQKDNDFTQSIPSSEVGESTLPGTSFTSSVMTEEEQDLVKKAMSSFALPTTNIPVWANEISEDEWLKSVKTQVLKR